jgi:hypothetical protein
VAERAGVRVPTKGAGPDRTAGLRPPEPQGDRRICAVRSGDEGRAARPRDLVDLQHLAELLELTRLEDLVAVHDAVFPGEPLPARTVQRLRVYWKGRERG